MTIRDLEEMLANDEVEFVLLAPGMERWSEHDRQLVQAVITTILKENKIVPRFTDRGDRHKGPHE